MSHTFKRGDRVRYSGCYINARGAGEFLDYDRDGDTLLAVVRINESIHSVVATGDNLEACDA